MFETLGEKAEEKAMVQFLERFTDYPFLVKFKNSEYPRLQDLALYFLRVNEIYFILKSAYLLAFFFVLKT